MLTARVLEDDILRGFEAGADDYLEKPYRLRVLLARAKALLRRGSSFSSSLFPFGEFKLDEEARILYRGTEEIQVTQKEFDLLLYLLRNEGRALSRDELLDSVWGKNIVVDIRTVDNFISSLKQKLRTTSRGFQIQTVRGVGYRLAVEELLDKT
jgi:DNA-binding response OmpR family regulator